MADYGSSVNFSERTTDIDTPPSGKAGIFLRDDKALYLKNDAGTVTKFGLAGDAPTAHAESHESGGTDELSLDASQVTTGTLPVGRGGTNADLSATGGTGQVLKQTSAGGAVTVGGLAESEIPDLSTDKLTSGTLPIGRGGTNATTAGGALTSLGAVATTDSRLSDARTPTTHAESHENGGDDELALDASQVTTGTLPVARGGTGATTLTGIVRGNGTSALTASALESSDLPAASSSGQGAVPTTSGKAEGDRLRVKADLTLEWFTPAVDDGKVSKLYTPAGVEAASVDSSGDTTFDGDIAAEEYTFYKSNNFKEYVFIGTTGGSAATFDLMTIDLSAEACTFMAYIEINVTRSGNAAGGKTGRYGIYAYATNSSGTTTFSVDTIQELNNPESSSFTFSLSWSGTDSAKTLQLIASDTYVRFFCKVMAAARDASGGTIF